MAILCWAAKNSLRGTTLVEIKMDTIARSDSYDTKIVLKCKQILQFKHIKRKDEKKLTRCKLVYISVRNYLILFYIERGFRSRTEIGDKEINGSAVHNISAVGNKTLFDCFPSPPPPLFTT